MSVTQTVLQYINSLKWPAVVVGGVYYFRGSVSQLLEGIGKSHKGTITGPAGTSISWDNTIREINAAVGSSASTALWAKEDPDNPIVGIPRLHVHGHKPENAPSPLVPADWPAIADLALVAPQAAVVLAFTQVEHAVQAFAERLGVSERAPRVSVRHLAGRIPLPDDVQTAIAQLSDLRNGVVHHETVPDVAMASEFVASAKGLYDYITLGIELFGTDWGQEPRG